MVSPGPPFQDAAWISSPVVGGPRTSAPAPYFRKSFHLPAPPTRATLVLTALGLYEAEINGHPVHDAVFAPGWTDYRIRIPYQTLDVSPLLRPGENVLGLLLGDGWFCGHIAEKNRQFYGDRPRFIARLEITLPDHPPVVIVSDSSWKTTTGPLLENDLIMGESHDARLDLGPWSSPGYDDSAWLPVCLASPTPATLVPQTWPPVRRQETLTARLLDAGTTSWMPKHLRYDLGQNISGRLRLTLRGRPGTTLQIHHAEMLNPDGSLHTDNLRTARATDHYTLRGDPTEVWEPRFTFHGFRYAEIRWQGSADDLQILSAHGIVLHSHLERTGHFSCSHPLLNQLSHNILWGLKGNFLEVPTDCPQRDERLGWTGDAQVFIRTAAFFMNVRPFFQKWLQDMRDAQGPAGDIPPVIPHTGSFGLPGDGGPAWADAAFICPWTLYQTYGDLSFLRDHYDTMCRYMAYLEKEKTLDSIRSHPDIDTWGGFGDWLALDGSGRLDGGTPKDLIGTAFYANNADILARTADLLDQPGPAAAWRDLHTRIVHAFRHRFITPAGLLASGTQTAYVLALHFNLVPPEVRSACARQLVHLIERNGWKIGTGFVGTPYLLHALEATGHLDVAYRLLLQEECPSWLFPVKNGATTIWERWDAWTPEKGFQDKSMNSFNHYAYGAVGDWMVGTVAGLQPAAPGYRQILFKPRPGGSLTHARASLLTPFGLTSIHWQLDQDTLRLELVVPSGSSATLAPPPGWHSPLVEFQPGTHTVALLRS